MSIYTKKERLPERTTPVYLKPTKLYIKTYEKTYEKLKIPFYLKLLIDYTGS